MAKRRRDPRLEPGDSEVTPSPCPACNYVMDCATDPFGKAKPGPGDFSVCLRCCEVLRFDDDMSLQKLVRSEWDYLDAHPELRRQLRRVVFAIKKVHGTMGRPADRLYSS